ncbi:hypothetical protein EKG38_00280 [Shewanella canadensis]|uniref:Uncharacterized protein n=2 Tax=Shewanella canadensis TaxID=271096 RepID=A0A431WYA1_9GAMM|nr:hypothetical protein EKG38_00280 [Shewanella canadensis]
MMNQARGHMNVASESLDYFDWSLRHVLNACNFAGASWYFGLQRVKEDEDEQSSLPWCGMEFHDLLGRKAAKNQQMKFDLLNTNPKLNNLSFH